jgi:glycosyltransferase involved in cell wall biosynthesis
MTTLRFLFAAAGRNRHIENMALALHEAGSLREVRTGGTDHFRPGWLAELRRRAGAAWPALDSKLSRRRFQSLPENLIHSDWTWEGFRSMAGRLGAGSGLGNALWERNVLRLDRRCARLIGRDVFDGFWGIEHGSLFSLRAARRCGKKTVLACTSLHSSWRRRWVETEYERFPEYATPDVRRQMRLARGSDRRRDEETAEADWILTNSRLGARSFIEAGVDARKVLALPLGSPSPASRPPEPPRGRPVFVFAGALAAHKGVPDLIEAWKRLRAAGRAELHLYGDRVLPEKLFRVPGVVRRGRVSSEELSRAFQQAIAFVFPSLGDGFGEVVGEALACALPVLVSTHAGASELVQDDRNGFRVAPRDPDSLAGRMAWFLDHPREAAKMRELAWDSARQWTWQDYRETLRRKIDSMAAAG